jgi:hypothetical protein
MHEPATWGEMIAQPEDAMFGAEFKNPSLERIQDYPVLCL